MYDDPITSASSPAQVSFTLASRNTGLALQRTRLAADRTLMAVIRTSLSLISFGFTIGELFNKLRLSDVLAKDLIEAPKFGLALVILGITMLVLGIAYHGQFMLALRTGRRRLARDGLLPGESPFPPSMTLITAGFLLLIGIAALLSMLYHVGPLN